jgi:D-2-hydroxyacid dehydrogenase (NADP+)
MRVLIMDEHAGYYKTLILGQFPSLEIDAANIKDEAVSLSEYADVLVILAPRIDDDYVRRAAGLRWIHALTSGTDAVGALTALINPIVLTSTRGIHGPQMAEMAILHMLALARDVARMVHNHDDRIWGKWPQQLMWQKTVAIVGLRVIAAEPAVRCRSFGMKVPGVTSTARAVEHFDAIYTRNELAVAAAAADFLVVLVPYDFTSHHLIDARVIGAMQKGAFLINLSRGGVVDESALADALKRGALAGAGLDVFSAEPLPPDNVLWELPKLFMTAHLGGMSDIYPQQAAPILLHNLTCYLSGFPEKMRNRVR